MRCSAGGVTRRHATAIGGRAAFVVVNGRFVASIRSSKMRQTDPPLNGVCALNSSKSARARLEHLSAAKTPLASPSSIAARRAVIFASCWSSNAATPARSTSSMRRARPAATCASARRTRRAQRSAAPPLRRPAPLREIGLTTGRLDLRRNATEALAALQRRPRLKGRRSSRGEPWRCAGRRAPLRSRYSAPRSVRG